MISPSGPRAAGKFGCSLLSIGATQSAGFDMLGHHWDVMEQRSAEFGNAADRRSWRLVSQVHVAETREQAYEDVAYGLDDYFEYFRKVAALPIVPEGGPDDLADQMNSSGAGVVGTPRGLHRDDREPDRAEQRRLRHLPDPGPRVGRTRPPPTGPTS